MIVSMHPATSGSFNVSAHVFEGSHAVLSLRSEGEGGIDLYLSPGQVEKLRDICESVLTDGARGKVA